MNHHPEDEVFCPIKLQPVDVYSLFTSSLMGANREAKVASNGSRTEKPEDVNAVTMATLSNAINQPHARTKTKARALAVDLRGVDSCG